MYLSLSPNFLAVILSLRQMHPFFAIRFLVPGFNSRGTFALSLRSTFDLFMIAVLSLRLNGCGIVLLSTRSSVRFPVALR